MSSINKDYVLTVDTSKFDYELDIKDLEEMMPTQEHEFKFPYYAYRMQNTFKSEYFGCEHVYSIEINDRKYIFKFNEDKVCLDTDIVSKINHNGLSTFVEHTLMNRSGLLFMPSGMGKSYLVRKYPNLLYDGDMVIENKVMYELLSSQYRQWWKLEDGERKLIIDKEGNTIESGKSLQHYVDSTVILNCKRYALNHNITVLTAASISGILYLEKHQSLIDIPIWFGFVRPEQLFRNCFARGLEHCERMGIPSNGAGICIQTREKNDNSSKLLLVRKGHKCMVVSNDSDMVRQICVISLNIETNRFEIEGESISFIHDNIDFGLSLCMGLGSQVGNPIDLIKGTLVWLRELAKENRFNIICFNDILALNYSKSIMEMISWYMNALVSVENAEIIGY